MLRTIGLMSGTSLDGVDAAWLKPTADRHLWPTLTLPYDDRLRADRGPDLDQAPNLDPDGRLQSAVARLTDATSARWPSSGDRRT
jgi:anhydro-N-acetylmuramic acid kinase